MMHIELPEAKLFTRQCGQETAWSDLYGALSVAAQYAGTAIPEQPFNAVWQHGCIEPWLTFSPNLLCFNTPDAERKMILVARKDERKFLHRNSFKNVRAIGLPFAYVPPSGYPRHPKSLLVVPTHTLLGDSFPDKEVFKKYVSEIVNVRSKFQDIFACIHPSCRDNGLWVDDFQAAGIQVVYGAHIDDANALKRMRCLFDQFEYVTTNGWGSHVAYALYCGAKVSVFGTKPGWLMQNMERDGTWSDHPDQMNDFLSDKTREAEKHFLSRFTQEPHLGVADVSTGYWLVGAGNRKSRGGMKRLLRKCYKATAKPPRSINVLAWVQQGCLYAGASIQRKRNRLQAKIRQARDFFTR